MKLTHIYPILTTKSNDITKELTNQLINRNNKLNEFAFKEFMEFTSINNEINVILNEELLQNTTIQKKTKKNTRKNSTPTNHKPNDNHA